MARAASTFFFQCLIPVGGRPETKEISFLNTSFPLEWVDCESIDLQAMQDHMKLLEVLIPVSIK